jgi:hypothetical protein
MKTITCREMGGMCDEPITGSTKDEMLARGMEHVEAAHPEMAQGIKSMAKDDPMMVEWEQKFNATWESTPDHS